jgi:hypothetical protein
VPIAPFAPLELYLMGLIAADGVPPFEVAVEPVRIHAKAPLVEFTASGFQTVSIEDLVAANGPRKPAYPDAPRHFRLGLVVLVGAALSPGEWEFFERSMDFMTAQDARRIEDVFAAEAFGAERAYWQAIQRANGQLLNFSTATGRRGSLGLSRPGWQAASVSSPTR